MLSLFNRICKEKIGSQAGYQDITTTQAGQSLAKLFKHNRMRTSVQVHPDKNKHDYATKQFQVFNSCAESVYYTHKTLPTTA